MKKYLLSLLIIVAGCGEQAEESEQGTLQESSNTNRSETLTWSAPTGWVSETPSSGFRKAQYRLPRVDGDPEDASCVVFHFGGEGGSAEANLERWYGQFKQPDGTPSKDVAGVKQRTVNGLQQTTVDLSGTYLFKTTPMSPHHTEKPNFRMLAAVIESESGPWFVKLVGPQKTVSKWEESFFEFLNSFK